MYRPRGVESTHGMLMSIVQPKWWQKTPHKERPFGDVLIDWDNLVARCEPESSEVISDGMRCATILGFAPKEIIFPLRSAAPSVRKGHRLMRIAIRDYLLGCSRASFVPPAPSRDTDAMDVGAVSTSSSKPTCEKCGKVGHTKEQCWSKRSTKGKGKGKSPSKGKDKNKKFTGTCNYCKKTGHKSADCRKKKAD